MSLKEELKKSELRASASDPASYLSSPDSPTCWSFANRWDGCHALGLPLTINWRYHLSKVLYCLILVDKVAFVFCEVDLNLHKDHHIIMYNPVHFLNMTTLHFQLTPGVVQNRTKITVRHATWRREQPKCKLKHLKKICPWIPKTQKTLFLMIMQVKYLD